MRIRLFCAVASWARRVAEGVDPYGGEEGNPRRARCPHHAADHAHGGNGRGRTCVRDGGRFVNRPYGWGRTPARNAGGDKPLLYGGGRNVGAGRRATKGRPYGRGTASKKTGKKGIDSFSLPCYTAFTRGCSSSVERRLPKPIRGVRFPSSAPKKAGPFGPAFFGADEGNESKSYMPAHESRYISFKGTNRRSDLGIAPYACSLRRRPPGWSGDRA